MNGSRLLQLLEAAVEVLCSELPKGSQRFYFNHCGVIAISHLVVSGIKKHKSRTALGVCSTIRDAYVMLFVAVEFADRLCGHIIALRRCTTHSCNAANIQRLQHKRLHL